MTTTQRQEIDRLTELAEKPSSNSNKYRHQLYAYIDEITASNLPEVFEVDSYQNEDYEEGERSYTVALSPQLADLRADLQYDGAGNANLTITNKVHDCIMLDISLDNGEINDIEPDFFK